MSITKKKTNAQAAKRKKLPVGLKIRYLAPGTVISGQVCEVADNQPGGGYDYELFHRAVSGLNALIKVKYLKGDIELLNEDDHKKYASRL